MKYVKRILCILLASLLLFMSPLSDYLDTSGMKKTEAMGTLTAGSVLELVLAGYGVTVASGALDSLSDSFGDWLNSSGSSESVEQWKNIANKATFALPLDLISDVGTWIGSKFSSLTSGKVGSVDCATYASGGAFPTAYSKLVFDYILDEIITSSNYVVFAKSGETDGTCFYKNLDAGVQYGIAVLTDTDGDSESCIFFVSADGSINSVRRDGGFYFNGLQYRYISSSGSWYPFDITACAYRSTIPIYHLPTSKNYFVLPSNLKTLTALATSSISGGKTYSNALTSYGNYATGNIGSLAGLVVTPSVVSSVMAKVNSALDANKQWTGTTDFTWTDTVAQAVADAYAKGIADAKANATDKPSTGGENTGILDWLSKILDAILSVPASIFSKFDSTLVTGFGLVSDVFNATTSIKDLITDIPATLVDGFREIFPTKESMLTLITGVPASVVQAMQEVFPVAQDIKEWITTVPKDIVGALSAGVGALSDGLVSVKDAVLAIPSAVAGTITDVLEALFVPDLSLVQTELDNIGNSFKWVGDLNSLVNDIMLKLEAGEPPTLYLDFTKAEDSKYVGAGGCERVEEKRLLLFCPYKENQVKL